MNNYLKNKIILKHSGQKYDDELNFKVIIIKKIYVI